MPDNPLPLRDNPRPTEALIPAILLVVTGLHVLVVQPAIVEGMVAYAGFRENDVGWIASAEMSGVVTGTLIAAFLATRVDWRKLCTFAVAIVVLGNLVSAVTHDLTAFICVRFFAGLGCGILYATGYAVLVLGKRPERNAGFAIAAVTIYGAVGVFLLPLVFAGIGLPGAFLALAALAAISFAACSRIPRRGVTTEKRQSIVAPITDYGLVLLTVFCLALAVGVVWAFLFLIGTSAGIPEVQVSYGLVMSNISSAMGGFAAAILPRWFSIRLLLSLAVVCAVTPLILFGNGLDGPVGYAIMVSAFQAGHSLASALVIALVAMVDRSGRLMSILQLTGD